MDTILEGFQTDYYKNINLIKNENLKSILQINKLEEKCNLLEQENTKLTNIINELNKEKKAKASSTIWESMNTKLAEKDNVIEQLKKDVEFYKRIVPKSNVTKSNLSDSIEVKDVKDVKEEKTSIKTKSVEKEIELKDEVLEVVEKEPVKQKDKIIVEDEIVDVVCGDKEEEQEEQEEQQEQEEEQVIKKSKKHKSKDKSKDKSEKKKKKKKKVVEEEEEND